MARTNTNRVLMTGNLTRDPELRSTNSGYPVCSLRLACNTRRKDASGNWVDKPNYFDVTVWGAPGENIAKYLSKGSPVFVDGRLEWREFTDREGNNRQAVEIVADSVEWLPDGKGGGQAREPASTGDYGGSAEPAGAYSGAVQKPEDDIPF